MTIARVDYLGFAKGINSDLMPDSMDDAQARCMDNFVIKSRGFETRPGTTAYNMTSYSGAITQVMEWLTPSGDVVTLNVRANNLYVINSDGTATLKQALSSSQVGWAVYGNGMFYFVDGGKYRVLGLFMYDTSTNGTAATSLTTTDVVRNTPISTHSTTPGTVGHYYMPKVSGSYTLQTADYGNTANWTDVTDATGTYCDRITEVVPDADATNMLGRINNCTLLAFHPTSNRMFAGGNPDYPSTVFYSESGKPNFFKGVSTLYPAGNFGSLKGLMAVSQSMVAAYKHGFMVWNGITPTLDATTATWKAMPIPVGILNKNAMVLGYNGLIFMSPRGYHVMSASLLGENNNILPPTDDYFLNLAENRISNILFDGLVNESGVNMTFCEGKAYLAYAHADYTTMTGLVDIRRGDIVLNRPLSLAASAAGTVNKFYQATSDLGLINLTSAEFGVTANWTEGSGTYPDRNSTNLANNRILVYDQETDAFVRFTGIRAESMCSTDDGSLMIGSKNYLLKLDEAALSDIDVETGGVRPIVQYFRSKPYSPAGDGGNHLRTNIISLYLTAGQRPEPLTSPIEVTVTCGYKSVYFTNVDLAESFRWGRQWGLRWGWTDFIVKEGAVKEDAYRHEIEIFSDTINNPMSIYSIGLEYEVASAKGTTMDKGTNLLT